MGLGEVGGDVSVRDVLKAHVAERPVVVDGRGARRAKVIGADGSVVGETTTDLVMQRLLEQQRLASELHQFEALKRCASCLKALSRYLRLKATESNTPTRCPACAKAPVKTCEDCGVPVKLRSARRCRACAGLEKGSFPSNCADCGARLSHGTGKRAAKMGYPQRCWPCRNASLRKERVPCSKCGTPLSRAQSKNHLGDSPPSHRPATSAPICRPCRKAVTHCAKGHEYTEENTIRTQKGRSCRECSREDCRKRRAARRKEASK